MTIQYGFTYQNHTLQCESIAIQIHCMSLNTPPVSPPENARTNEDTPLRRSGAVARMLRMPVATLRVWERRYALTPPRLSASGQRLYSEEDVRRLAVIKQLTELGHAIGSLAKLDMAQLQRVGAAHARVQAMPPQERHSTPRAWRLAVIGAALGARLHRPALLRRLGRPVQLLGPFETPAQAAAALQRADIDALLIHEPQLHAGWRAAFDAAAPTLAGLPTAVLYGFATDVVCESLAAVGITLLREPQPDVVLAQWLHHLAESTCTLPPDPRQPLSTAPAEPQRRWDDAALVDFANRSSTVACECPRHVAELLMQLAHFERYSAECAHRHAADAKLHAYLQQVAARSRARFEAALEQIALHEGVLLPPTA